MEKELEKNIYWEDLELKSQLENYIIKLEELGKSILTRKNYKIWISEFLQFLEFSENSAAARKKEDIILEKPALSLVRFREYLKTRKGRGGNKQSYSTINLKVIAVNSFYRYCDISELTPRGKSQLVQVQLLETEKKLHIDDDRVLELKDFLELIKLTREANDLRSEALFTLLFNTGARISEVLNINLGDIVKTSAGGFKVKITGKRDKKRDISFNADTFEIIKEYVVSTNRSIRATNKIDSSNADPLFINVRAKKGVLERMTPANADYLIKKYGKQLDLPLTKFFAHNVRHLLAKTLLDKGNSLDKVKNILGHASISTTAIYTMGKASELVEAKENSIQSAVLEVLEEKQSNQLKKLEKKYKNNSVFKLILPMVQEAKGKITAMEICRRLKIPKSTFSDKYSGMLREIKKTME